MVGVGAAVTFDRVFWVLLRRIWTDWESVLVIVKPEMVILCLLFIHPPAHGSEVSPAARNTLDSARIPRASKLLICGLFLKGRVLAQDGVLIEGSNY